MIELALEGLLLVCLAGDGNCPTYSEIVADKKVDYNTAWMPEWQGKTDYCGWNTPKDSKLSLWIEWEGLDHKSGLCDNESELKWPSKKLRVEVKAEGPEGHDRSLLHLPRLDEIDWRYRGLNKELLMKQHRILFPRGRYSAGPLWRYETNPYPQWERSNKSSRGALPRTLSSEFVTTYPRAYWIKVGDCEFTRKDGSPFSRLKLRRKTESTEVIEHDGRHSYLNYVAAMLPLAKWKWGPLRGRKCPKKHVKIRCRNRKDDNTCAGSAAATIYWPAWLGSLPFSE